MLVRILTLDGSGSISHPFTLRLDKLDAPENIYAMLVTLDVLKFDRSSAAILETLLNIRFISVTLAVLKLVRSKLVKFEAF